MIPKRSILQHRWLWRSVTVFGALGLLLWGVWCSLPYCVEDPLPILLARQPAQLFTDRSGQPLYARSGYDAQWRFDIPLSAVSTDAIRVTLIAEDANFYRHHGVDYAAGLRALWQNVTSGSIISGASTISMQVASLAFGRDRSLRGKLLQAARARKMERLHDKATILEAYLNHAPYGGKITGIEAAARYYFNTSAQTLTFAETTLLCGLPQRPNALRLDRHFHAARQRQRRLLKMMVRRSFLTESEAQTIFQQAGIRCRDYSTPATFLQFARPNEYFHAIQAGYSICAALQDPILTLLRRQQARLPNVHDGACVVLDRHAPEHPMVYIGTLRFDDPRGGQVDAAKCIRSAGSVLKPFIYAAAIQGGVIAPATLLLDAPLRYKDYTPTNYNGSFHGYVSVHRALTDSLNTPVIRLLSELNDTRIGEHFQALGLPYRDNLGLTLALGTGGTSLLQLVNAYHRLDNVFSPETESLIAHILRRPLPHTTLDIAWKTGTANNNTDAWCVGWTPDYVVGVWFGNKDGRRSEALVGLDAAAPVIGDIFNILYAKRARPFWTEPSTQQKLCVSSGLRAKSTCHQTFQGFVHATIPLRQCSCDQPPDDRAPLILSPIAATYYGDEVSLPLIATRTKTRWFLNGTAITTPQLTLAPGLYTLRAIHNQHTESVDFSVIAR